MAVTQAKLRFLSNFLEGDTPNSDGEIGLHCPFHPDENRSASLNVNNELWYCNTCDIGGAVDELVQRIRSGGVEYDPSVKGTRSSRNGSNGVRPLPSEAEVAGWHSGLLGRRYELQELQHRRGLSLGTIKKWKIGWDPAQDAYTIPIRGSDGELVNIRFYQLDPTDDRRKIWSVAGHGEPVLYPINVLEENEQVVICEGEWDTLLTLQSGFPAVTRTGAAKVWKDSWNPQFEGKTVYICHDMDEPGQLGNVKVAAALQDYADAVYIVPLPYPVVEKHGKDLTDYWLDGFNLGDFIDLLLDLTTGSPTDEEKPPPVDVRVLDTLASDYFGKPMTIKATVAGKRKGTYLLPKVVEYTCTMDAGPQCQICPMLGYKGNTTRTVDSHDPLILSMMDSSNEQLDKMLRNHVGAQKCNQLEMENVQAQSVEILQVRPSMDTGGSTDHTTREIVSVDRHDTPTNTTVEIIGTVYPDPRSQNNRFQAWEVHKTVNDFETFVLKDQEAVKLLLPFQSGPEGPAAKLYEIADELASGVTHIYGRRLMHVIMDLTWHSVISFYFMGELQRKGWLDILIVGDTRTGKSYAAGQLAAWYQAGEVVSCESTSFAGVVGGLQQIGNKDWSITWGVIPLNDRRLVVLDEVSGLAVEEIAKMSSIRSSGTAEITKIDRDTTHARTRLLWMGNPRNASMERFTYGVYAMEELIGNREDIARFDLAMSVRSDDVDKWEINRQHDEESCAYTQEQCQTLLRWVWSRRPDQVIWRPGVEQLVLEMAVRLSEQFIDDPPLIQAANVRYKLARVAVALAARTFSTDRAFENIIVKREHVRGASELIADLYGDDGFGYAKVSEKAREDKHLGVSQYDDSREWLHNNAGLVKFLSSQRSGHFRTQDLEDMLNMDREQAKTYIAKMFSFGLVRKDGANIRMLPFLHQMIRELNNRKEADQ